MLVLLIFLRKLSEKNISELIAGKLLNNVLIYFNWNKFGELFKEYSGEFKWSNKKEGRRERSKPFNKQMCMVIDDRIPKIYYKNDYCSLTGANFIQIIFDGIKPSSMAAKISEFFTVRKN